MIDRDIAIQLFIEHLLCTKYFSIHLDTSVTTADKNPCTHDITYQQTRQKCKMYFLVCHSCFFFFKFGSHCLQNRDAQALSPPLNQAQDHPVITLLHWRALNRGEVERIIHVIPSLPVQACFQGQAILSLLQQFEAILSLLYFASPPLALSLCASSNR